VVLERKSPDKRGSYKFGPWTSIVNCQNNREVYVSNTEINYVTSVKPTSFFRKLYIVLKLFVPLFYDDTIIYNR
jgi:hypothetical protein